jgi:hypothetical protein
MAEESKNVDLAQLVHNADIRNLRSRINQAIEYPGCQCGPCRDNHKDDRSALMHEFDRVIMISRKQEIVNLEKDH